MLHPPPGAAAGSGALRCLFGLPSPLPASLTRRHNTNTLHNTKHNNNSDIVRDYQGRDLVVVGVLKGAFIFTSDLARAVASRGLPGVKVDFVRAASYGAGSTSSGSVAVDMCSADGGGDASSSSSSRWQGMDVLLVEDIVDTGRTLQRLASAVASCGASSVRVAALLDKRARRAVEFEADYVGWAIPDRFIVGYGLDFDEAFRCLPYVASLKPSAYQGR